MTERQERWLTRRLAVAPPFAFTLFASGAAFSCYFCMYAFRKPFSAATYEGLTFLKTSWWDAEIELKTALVVSQIVGYALSKIVGIKLCSEAKPEQRAPALIALILLAEIALVLFAILPGDWKVLAIFLNGLPLGMIWGMVVWYLEGRRTSEILLAGLSCSFILASGVVKDVGRWLMTDWQLDQFWMPSVAGVLFLPLFGLSVWLLDQLPAPTARDQEARVKRRTMLRRERLHFVGRFLPGLITLLIAYFFLTAYRDFRDNFGVEIFSALGYEGEPAIFTRSEVWVAFGVMAGLAALSMIRDNRRGVLGAFALMIAGVGLMGAGTWMHDTGRISGLTWMIACGLGSYLAYVPYGSVLFDRIIASTRATGTAVFAIYLADAVGYGGAISVLVFKDVLAGDVDRLEFFRQLTYFMSVAGVVLLVTSCLYFLAERRRSPDAWPRGQEPV